MYCLFVQALFLPLMAAWLPEVRAQTVEYRPRDGQEFGYQIQGEADRGTHTDKISGTIIYTVKSLTADKITLQWISNIHMQDNGGGRGGPGPRPGFASLPASGGNSGTLQMNSQGEVISTKDASHLPYLLGDAATLMIEPLPEAGRTAWNVESSVTLAESGERLPGPPRGSQDPSRKKTVASETAIMKVSKLAGGELTVEKRSLLKTVELMNGKPRVEIMGQGQWTFDTERKIPKRLEWKQTVTARSDDRTSIEIPVTLSVSPLSEEEIKRIETEREQRHAQLQEKFKEQKAKRMQPLDDETIKALLADLESGNTFKMQQSLQKLANRPVGKVDPAIAAAIKPLLMHKNMGVRHAAADAWAKYSAEPKAP
jgi:hypothetical protein